MKKALILLAFTLLAAAVSAQVKETQKIRKDSAGRIYRERTIVVPEYLPDTLTIAFQIRQLDIEMDTLKSRRKRLVQDLKDWKKAFLGPPGTAPNSAPRSEDTAPATPISVPNPDANKPPVKEKGKKKKNI